MACLASSTAHYPFTACIAVLAHSVVTNPWGCYQSILCLHAFIAHRLD